MTQQDWDIYFATLAAEHTLLRHTPQDKHFFRGEVEEFFGDLRSKVRFPALIMETGLLTLQRNDAGYFSNLRTLAFIVAQNNVRDNWDDISAALADCEVIGSELIGRLVSDIDGDLYPGFDCLSLTKVDCEPLANPPQKYVGWRFEFVVSEPACLINPNHWLRS